MIDSSPSSVGSASFRELDEVFLQTQTRIWIGEVLQTRLDDDLHLSDLLQDGEILLEVSKVVWTLLVSKCMELKHLKHKYGPFGSRKSSGRYRPYSNVDSFLKLCKILGLSGIDLFSPSDVVEKRDIRKVCICIRALSKKTRSKQLSVPDFDVVICSVTMPTDIVGGIRKSLESSQCTILSSTSSYSPCRGSNMKLKQTKIYAAPNRDEDSSSEASDEAESRYMGDHLFSPDRENSPEAYSGSARHIRTEKCYCTEECEKTPCNNDSTYVGDSSCIINDREEVEENNYIADYLAFSDLMVHASDGNSSMILDGENSNMFDFFLKVDSNQGLPSDRMSSKYKKFLNDEDIDEVSSTTSMSSVLGRLLSLEFEEQFALDCNNDEKHVKDRSPILSENHKTGSVDSRETQSEDRLNESCDSAIINQGDGLIVKSDHVMDEDDYKVVHNKGSGSYSDHETENKPSLHENRIISCFVQEHDNNSSSAQNPQQVKGSEVDCKKETNNKTHRVRKDLIIKTVVKGTALAGLLFLLMHIRKSRGEHKQETSVHHQTSKANRSKPSSKHKAENRSGKGIYSSERLKF